MTNRRTRRAIPALRTGLPPVLALLLLLGVSCGPSGGTEPPPDGDTSVHVTVTGPGRVVQGDLDCTGSCTWTGDDAQDVTFQAVPNPGNVLVAWGGACPALAEDCTRTFEDGDEIAVTFAPHALRLDLTGDGEGQFHIAGGPVNVTCDGECGVAVDTELPLQLAVTYEDAGTSGTELGSWTGACASATLDGYCLVTVSGATNVGKTWTHPPVAADDAYTATRNAELVVDADDGVLANDEDTANDVLTAEVDDGPSHGTLDLAADGGFTYTPDSGYFGPDTFSYTVRDAFGSDDGADVAIDVTNRAPVASLDRYETVRDTPLTIDAPGVLTNDVDPDGDVLTATLVDDVQTGTLTFRPDGGFDYEPAPDFAGNDRFTYRATDGDLRSAVTTVTIAVAGTNRAPTTEPDAYEVSRGGELSIAAPGVLANDDDPDGDALTAVLVPGSGPARGTLEFASDGGFTYTPDGSYVGDVQFQYRADDGEELSEPATVTIEVTNAAPVAADDPAGGGSYEVEQDEDLDVDADEGVLANDTDPDGDDLTAALDTRPANGRVRLNHDGGFTYTSDHDYAGPDSFTYVANDGDLDSDPATVSILVTDDDDDDDEDDEDDEDDD